VAEPNDPDVGGILCVAESCEDLELLAWAWATRALEGVVAARQLTQGASEGDLDVELAVEVCGHDLVGRPGGGQEGQRDVGAGAEDVGQRVKGTSV
jgi:hypothetical protein